MLDWVRRAVAPPPSKPAQPAFLLDDTAPSFLAVFVWSVLPIILYLGMVASGEGVSPSAKSAKDAKGAVVPKDTERRKAAQAEAPAQRVGLQRAGMLAAFLVPHALLLLLQSGPSAGEQVREWVRLSYAQLTDGNPTLPFQLAVAALSIERLCYTWVHTFSTSFVSFALTPIGRMMGRRPLDVVFTIFCINKVVQVGTFVLFYAYVLEFQSPFAHGFSFANRTALQWTWLFYAIVIGQGLNSAIYRAIGKAGVYYGYRLGESVPWVTGFPFSVVPHPQYFGACITCIGINVFTATQQHVEAGWFNLTAAQVLYYVYMAFVEDYL